MKPTITTVIPTYRRPDLVRRAVLSVLAQTWHELRVIVVDDASGDSTRTVVADLMRGDSRVSYLCQPENLGLMGNQAAAVNQAHTPFWNILNDDDFLAPEFFAAAMREFERYPQAEIFVGRLLYWDVKTPERTRMFYGMGREGLFHPPATVYELLTKEQNHTWTSMMFRREALERIGPVDAEVGYAGDLDFILRALAHCPAVFSAQTCAVYSLTPRSVSYVDWLSPHILSMQRMLKKFAADETLDADVRRKILGLITQSFRRTAIIGAGRALAMGAFEPARRAADFLDGTLRCPLAAAAIRIAASGSPVGSTARAALRNLKLARRRLRKDPATQQHLEYVFRVLQRIEPGMA